MPVRHSNLPARRTALLGRAHDLSSVGGLVRNGQGRMVTLAGAGGVGKTSLAIEVGRALQDEVPDGIWWVDLGRLDSPGALALAACSALGLADRTCTPEELLGEFLEPREALLIFDGCEHVAAAVGELADALLDRCPDLRILATSRIPLHVRGEAVYVLPALEVPDQAVKRSGADPATMRAIAELPAVRLFLERARLTRADFELTPDIAGTVASICRRLDGLPLAIEFAAAEVAALTPAEIEARLAREQGLKASRHRIGPSRQRTMEATLDWSHGLLSSDEQALFRRLSIFAGGWTLEAAEAVCGEGGSVPVSETLITLVEHSLVVREVAAGETRFRFLRTVAEYASEKLSGRGESAVVSMAHARYFMGIAGLRDPGRIHASPADLDRIAGEHENCVAALRWALRARVTPLATALFASLVEYWRIRGLLRVGIGFMEQLLGLIGEAPSPERAFVLMALADYGQVLGDLEMAEQRAFSAVDTGEALGDPVRLRTAYGIVGNIAASRGDYEAARAWYARAGALLTRDHEPLALAFWLANVGGFAVAEGNDEEARRLLERSLDSFAQVGPIWYRGRVLVQLGALARRRGELELAEALLVESLEWFRSYVCRPESVECLVELGRLALDTGNPLRAVTFFGAASGLRDAMGLPGSASSAWPDDDIDRARDRLPSESFTQAWARGRETPLDEVAELVPLPASTPDGAKPHPAIAVPAGSVSAATGTATSERAPMGSAMTPRERQVAELVALGLTNSEIAERLGITTGTARIHIERILSKLGLNSRVQIATWIVRNAPEPPVEARRN